MPPGTPKSRSKRGRASASPAPNQTQNPGTGDVVPGRLTKSEWVTMVTGQEGEEAVSEILDELMCHVMEKCYRVYLYRQLLPFTVSKARDTLEQALEWHFFMQDRGEGPESAALWAEGPEPRPGVTDSWAEGSVPVRSSSSPAPLTSAPQAGPHVPKSLQRTTAPPVGKAATPQDKDNIQPLSQASAVHNNPGKEQRGRAEEPGAGGISPTPTPPPRRKRQPPHQSGLPALRTPPLPLLGQSLARTPCSDERDPTAAVPKATRPPRPRPPDVPAVQRLNPTRLPRRYFCPGFEVLKSSPAALPSRMRGARRPQAPSLYEGLSKWGPPGGPVCVFSTRNLQDGGPPQGFSPLSACLLLDAMKLAPGVSIRAPAKPLKERPSQPEPSPHLIPIRSSLPAPPPIRDRLILGPPPRVVPGTSPGETAGPV
ncbi:hypothetical protein SKAU_G00122940 [Synaphobranchus kaupii]|uniref:Uncharacterized protein n=1 Tax=Synaphobranchus kaupii TaxID=118154 RepID=A0A9Q1FP32_SYNKA|nr:hypothetical protein SKAU_G00122940 [Synaphobranchus kaupii]